MNLQSLDELRWEIIASIALFIWITQTSFHQQTMLNVYVQRIFGCDGMLFVLWQQFSDHIRKEIREAARILLHSLSQWVAELMQIVQINSQCDLI